MPRNRSGARDSSCRFLIYEGESQWKAIGWNRTRARIVLIRYRKMGDASYCYTVAKCRLVSIPVTDPRARGPSVAIRARRKPIAVRTTGLLRRARMFFFLLEGWMTRNVAENCDCCTFPPSHALSITCNFRSVIYLRMKIAGLLLFSRLSSSG